MQPNTMQLNATECNATQRNATQGNAMSACLFVCMHKCKSGSVYMCITWIYMDDDFQKHLQAFEGMKVHIFLCSAPVRYVVNRNAVSRRVSTPPVRGLRCRTNRFFGADIEAAHGSDSSQTLHQTLVDSVCSQTLPPRWPQCRQLSPGLVLASVKIYASKTVRSFAGITICQICQNRYLFFGSQDVCDTVGTTGSKDK